MWFASCIITLIVSYGKAPYRQSHARGYPFPGQVQTTAAASQGNPRSQGPITGVLVDYVVGNPLILSLSHGLLKIACTAYKYSNI